MDMSAVAKLLAPFLVEFSEQVLFPELKKLEDQIGSEDLKLVVETLTAAVQAIAKAEIAKI